MSGFFTNKSKFIETQIPRSNSVRTEFDDHLGGSPIWFGYVIITETRILMLNVMNERTYQSRKSIRDEDARKGERGVEERRKKKKKKKKKKLHP